jgi:hypothetical protein
MAHYTTDHVSPELADRLIKICGQFGADNDNLVLVAARTAQRMLKEAGSTWQEAFQPALTAPEPRRQKQQNHYRDDWRRDVAFCLEENQESRGALLSDWEVNFLHNLLNFRELSPKQRALLSRLKTQVVVR